MTRLALDNSRITILVTFLIIAVGITTYLSYPSAEDPTIVIRNASISVGSPGMSAERVEELITKRVEAAMREIAEIDEIKSTSKASHSLVELTIHDWVKDLDPVFQDIRNKVSDLQGDLPSSAQTPVIEDEKGLTAVATIALWADGFSLAEMRDLARDVRDRLYTLEGVKKILLLGIQEERIYLQYSPERLAGYGVSPKQIFNTLAQQNIIKPGGSISAGSRSVLLEPSGDLESIDELRDVVISVPNSERVFRLEEIVDIRRDYVDPPKFPAFFNDHPAIILSVSSVEGVNNVDFGQRLKRMVDDLQQEVPIGYRFEFATYQPDLIEEAVGSAVSNVYQTLAIVFVVVLLFLGFRTGLIVGLFVPLTMLLGIIVMRFMDVELQRMSIAAMIIALGMLVDNGIVVAEDIRVRLQRGTERIQAAIEAGRTLALPLLTSSLTTILAFAPMLLIEGSAGDYVRSLSQVVSILLLSSWLLSMTVTPAMCAWFMKTPVGEAPASTVYSGMTYRLYAAVLRVLIRLRLLFIAALILLLFGAVQLLGTVKTEFFPLGDRNQFLVYMDFEAGIEPREVEPNLRKLTQFLSDKKSNSEVISNAAYIGFGGPRFFLALSPVEPDPHRAFVLVNTRDAKDVAPLIDRVNAFLDENIPAARSDAKQMWFGATEPGIVQIRLIGPNADVLVKASRAIVDAFHAVPGTLGIKQDWENKTLKLIIDVDQTRARRAGVTSSDIAAALGATFEGTTVSEFREGDKILPIVVRGDNDIRQSLAGLQRVNVYSAGSNTFVGLEQVATVRGEWQYGRIKRRNQQRTLTIEARNPNQPAPVLFAKIRPTLEKLDLPAGTTWEVGGEIEDQQEANSELFAFLPLALAGIVILLVGQFNSFRKGGIIILTIPLILIGGTLGLIVMEAPYGFMVLLGFFSLAGIVINNGIVLIDRIEAEQANDAPAYDAVITACLARLRPILMTTLTTTLGLVPLILFGGALFYGMASVIAFGLIVATVLTLGFVPALYTLLFRISVSSTDTEPS
jgi:multidrug efflux pump subunit AcrB